MRDKDKTKKKLTISTHPFSTFAFYYLPSVWVKKGFGGDDTHSFIINHPFLSTISITHINHNTIWEEVRFWALLMVIIGDKLPTTPIYSVFCGRILFTDKDTQLIILKSIISRNGLRNNK